RVLLRVREQLLLEREILVAGRAPGARAGDRSEARPPVLEPDERLGRGARDREAAELEEVHVRGRIQQAKAAVGLERIEVRAAAEALREHDLIDVAGRDVALRALDRIEERAAGEARLGRREAAGARRLIDPAAQRPPDLRAQRPPLRLVAGVPQHYAAVQV